MLLLGPEAMQLATCTGWRLQGQLGGLLAGLLFVMPGVAVILVLAIIHEAFEGLQLMQRRSMGSKLPFLWSQ